MRTPALNLDDAAGISKITAAHQTTHPCHQPQTLVAVFGVISFEDASELSAIAGPSLLVDSEPVIHNSGVNGTSTRPQQDGRDNSTRTTAKSRANALDSLPPPQSQPSPLAPPPPQMPLPPLPGPPPPPPQPAPVTSASHQSADFTATCARAREHARDSMVRPPSPDSVNLKGNQFLYSKGMVLVPGIDDPVVVR